MAAKKQTVIKRKQNREQFEKQARNDRMKMKKTTVDSRQWQNVQRESNRKKKYKLLGKTKSKDSRRQKEINYFQSYFWSIVLSRGSLFKISHSQIATRGSHVARLAS